VAIRGTSIAYAVAGGLLIYSGIKGSSITDTVKSALSGSLNPADTEPLAGNVDTKSSSGSAVPAAGDTGSANNTAAANQALAKSIIAANPAYSGWGSGQEWADLVSLWNQESGWSAVADNKQSGAYGIPQALPATKMPQAAQPPPAGNSDPTAQINWGLSYIKGRYGSPSMAWAHEVANNWY
jgi:hypothetical protein